MKFVWQQRKIVPVIHFFEVPSRFVAIEARSILFLYKTTFPYQVHIAFSEGPGVIRDFCFLKPTSSEKLPL